MCCRLQASAGVLCYASAGYKLVLECCPYNMVAVIEKKEIKFD